MIKLIETISDLNLETISKIWLDSNLDTHDFIEKDYWLKNYPAVKNTFPTAKIYVYYHNDEIVGFLGMIDNYIAGIFISKDFRSLGIGTQLLNDVQAAYSKLALSVYQKNERAYHFYLKHGFKVIKNELDLETNEIELFMEWAV
ncbi:hypothetical protein IGI39_003747 [Enterococcus sp. AZ135]|uniref:GNAT family N-acetyltransferase n=1 Tax=unclassified Enterococcus TaxID=2608891 RepID=UPI003F235E5C